MTAALLVVLGLWVAFLLGLHFYLGAKMDALAVHMDAAIDRLEGRFDALDARLEVHLDRHAS